MSSTATRLTALADQISAFLQPNHAFTDEIEAATNQHITLYAAPLISPAVSISRERSTQSESAPSLPIK
jgi:hypothetical protein